MSEHETSADVVDQEHIQSVKEPRDRDLFEYDVALEDEDSHASAAQLALLEKRHKKLLDQVDELEDKLFDSEELRNALQRKLALLEEELVDFKSLLKRSDSTHMDLRKQFDESTSRMKDAVEQRIQADSNRRQLEHKILLLQTEAEENDRSQHKLEQAEDEVDRLRMEIDTLIAQKTAAAKILHDADIQKSALEKTLAVKTTKSKEDNSKIVNDFDKLVEEERKKGQEAIDYVRRTLNSKIKFLELQLEANRESEANNRKEKRKLETELQNASRDLEEAHAQSTRNTRRLESLERQLISVKQRYEKLLLESDMIETENYGLQRQLDSMNAEYNSAMFINERLNAELPKPDQMAIDDEHAAKKSSEAFAQEHDNVQEPEQSK